MATVTYNWGLYDFLAPLDSTVQLSAAPAIGALASGSFFDVWTDGPGRSSDIMGRIDPVDASPGSTIAVNSTTSGPQSGASVAGLSGGNAVVSFTHFNGSDGDIRVRLFDPGGTALGPDFGIVTDAFDDKGSDVAALADGGFAVSWTRDFGAGDLDIRLAVLNEDGSIRANVVPVDSSDDRATSASSVAGLAGGGIVAVWESEPVAGGDTEVWFRRFDASGVAQGGGVLIDTVGSINEDIQVAALADGGFAVAYTDNGWGLSGTEVTLRIFNADGTTRSGFIRVNDTTGGDQNNPSITALPNGFVAVSFNLSPGLIASQAYDAAGNALGDNDVTAQDISLDFIEGETAAGDGGFIGSVLLATDTATGDETLVSQTLQLYREITGDDTSESLIGGDDLMDVIEGMGGNDALYGGTWDDFLEGGDGADIVNGGSDNDRLRGGTGEDVLYGGGGDDNLHGLASDDGSGDEADTLYGGSGNDFLAGGGGTDMLVGVTGADTLDGGRGKDILDGEASGFPDDATDTFLFRSTKESPGSGDIINDFAPGIDIIDVSEIDADKDDGGQQAFVFIGQGTFSAPGQIRAVQAGQATILEFNTTERSAGAEMVIVLKHVDASALAADDFVL
jgi:Ca2+-binding RTX toxin-like protein